MTPYKVVECWKRRLRGSLARKMVALLLTALPEAGFGHVMVRDMRLHARSLFGCSSFKLGYQALPMRMQYCQ